MKKNTPAQIYVHILFLFFRMEGILPLLYFKRVQEWFCYCKHDTLINPETLCKKMIEKFNHDATRIFELSFNWSDTPEGEDYWFRISEKWKKFYNSTYENN